jgi:isoleucyl-tRNA synthetase
VADAALATRMEATRRLVGLGRAARTDAAIKTRQPLRRALLLHPGAELDDDVRAEIATELNVKVLEDVDTLSGLLTWTVVPNFKKLGPRLGPRVNEIKQALAAADGNELQRHLEAEGWVEVGGERLAADEVEVRATRHESFALAEDQGWAVALDLELDDELRGEGIARELVRALNDHRKAVGLDIADRVTVVLGATDPALLAAVGAHADWIAGEVLATSLTVATDLDGDPAQLVVGDATVDVGLTRA